MAITVRTPIRLAVFPGAFNWPIWVAQERGLFSGRGVSVEVNAIPGSVVQWTNLTDGSADVVITLLDNVVAYCEGQGEAPVIVPDAVAVMSCDARLMPALMVQSDIQSYADLKGQTLSVDAVLTGLALILFALLEAGGLGKEDYKIVKTGGVLQRFEALKRHEFAGALFNTPFSSELEQIGFRKLDTAKRIVPSYQGHVVTVRRAWADSHTDALIGLLRALIDAIDWLYEPANRKEALAIFDKFMPGAGENAARVAYSVLFDPTTGFAKNGALDSKGIVAVLALRSKFGVPPKTLQPPQSYLELKYLEAALRL